ncbi:MAG: hypothetical protein BWY88_01061 [Synergistetes bacterium ADurb.Bin520]|nr:MAG: hypothetical protein BWY88_01061 [Synergistetes bacterium ADurb.Bin520]
MRSSRSRRSSGSATARTASRTRMLWAVSRMSAEVAPACTRLRTAGGTFLLMTLTRARILCRVFSSSRYTSSGLTRSSRVSMSFRYSAPSAPGRERWAFRRAASTRMR